MVQYANQQYEPQKKTVQPLKGGLDQSKPASDIDDTAASNLLNVQFYQGKLRADTGYLQYRQTIDIGVPMGQFQFIQTSGALQTLLITTGTLYKDNGTQWEYVSDAQRLTTLASSTGATSDVFQLVNVSPNWKVGQKIGIRMSDGSQLMTTLTQIGPGNSIQTLDGVPMGLMAVAGGDVVGPVAFSGSIEIQPTGITWPITNWFIFTNGVDPPWKYDGTTVQPLQGNPPICRTLAEFHGFLIVGNTQDANGEHPVRLQNSDEDNPEQWQTGLAFFVDLVDTEDPILDMDELGPWLIIYRHASVMRRSYIGDLSELFFDEYTLQGIGIESTGCVAPTGNSHFFFGDQGFFLYQGGYDVEDVGEKIFDSVFGPVGNFNDSLSSQSFCFYVAELDEVWVFYPSTTAVAFCDTLLRYNLGDDSWWVRQFANEMCGFGFIEATAGRTWLQATETWEQDTLPWNARANTEQAPQTILCDGSGMRTFLYDYRTTTDNGNVIGWSWTSKDFLSSDYRIRTDGLVMRGIGNNINVELSTDGGVTYQSIGLINFGLSFSQQKVNFQTVADAVRIQLSGNDPAFALDLMRMDFFQETPW